MQVKLLPPLWAQGLWHCLDTHTHKYWHISSFERAGLQTWKYDLSCTCCTLLLYFWGPSLNLTYGSLRPLGSMGMRFRPSISAMLTIPRQSWAFRCSSDRRIDCCCWATHTHTHTQLYLPHSNNKNTMQGSVVPALKDDDQSNLESCCSKVNTKIKKTARIEVK